MTSSNRCKSNRNLRRRFDEIISRMPVGEILLFEEITERLRHEDKRRYISKNRVSAVIRGNPSMTLISDSVWQKVRP